MREHYKIKPISNPLADVLLAVSIGLVLAAILLEYLA
jgi:hypothetical protein